MSNSRTIRRSIQRAKKERQIEPGNIDIGVCSHRYAGTKQIDRTHIRPWEKQENNDKAQFLKSPALRNCWFGAPIPKRFYTHLNEVQRKRRFGS